MARRGLLSRVEFNSGIELDKPRPPRTPRTSRGGRAGMLEVVAELPVTKVGKLDKKALRDMLARTSEGV
jgi:acyl-CoA synthetase (AMP-forming)/AMP-acid ligase II